MGRDRFVKLLEKLLPATATDAERAALRAKPQDYEQYLKALDEVYGPKEQRAADMDLKKKVFHGTDADIEAFRPSDIGYYGPGVYTADRATAANEFVGNLPGGQIYPLRISDNLLNLLGVSNERSAQIAKDKGLAGMTAPWKGYNVTPDPKNIRSEFAAFDPRFKGKTSDILAGMAGAAALGAATMSPDEANAAGVETIMQKLGVGLEEAQKIKQLAKTKLPEGVFEENIRALQQVGGFKRDYSPQKYPVMGSGSDYRAHLTPEGKVLKEPRGGLEHQDVPPGIASALTEHAGLGPNTKTIMLNGQPYIIQDKAKPLADISRRASRQGGDPELERLYKLHDIAIDNPASTLTQIDELSQQIRKRKHELYKIQGLDPDQLAAEYKKLNIRDRNFIAENQGIENLTDVYGYPADAFEGILKRQAHQKLYPAITPDDLHLGNIGLSQENKPTIFDTSRYHSLSPEHITPEQREAIMNNYLAVPEKRREMLNFITPPEQGQYTRDGGFVKPISTSEVPEGGWVTGKRAAAMGGAALGLGAVAGSSDEAQADIFSGGKKLLGAERKAVLEKLIEQAQRGEHLYHGTTREVAKQVGEGGALEPQIGKIVESAYGEYLNPEEYRDVVQPAVFMAKDPGYVGKSKIWDKPNMYDTSRTPEFIKKHGGLAVIEPSDEFHVKGSQDNFTSLLKGEPTYPFESPYSMNSSPINVEPGDIISTDSVVPSHTLTGPDLVEFMRRAWPSEIDAKKAAAMGGGALGLGALSRKAQAEPIVRNPASQVGEAYQKYWEEPRKAAVDWAANKLSEGLTLPSAPGGMSRDEMKAQNKEILGTGLDFASDPTMYVEGPVGWSFPVLTHMLSGPQDEQNPR